MESWLLLLSLLPELAVFHLHLVKGAHEGFIGGLEFLDFFDVVVTLLLEFHYLRPESLFTVRGLSAGANTFIEFVP